MRLWTLGQWLIGCQLQFKFSRDAKSSLAVLHNQNDMVTHFKASSWVSEAQGAVVSRGVTTCAGMTAHTVIVAQTKIGFLTGGRRASFHDLCQEEQDIQLEEAYGRATVALTRARSLCGHYRTTGYERDSLVRLLSLDRLCMGLGMCSRAKPTSICTGAPFATLHLMQTFGQVAGKEQLPYFTLPSTSCDCGGTAR